MDSQNIWKKLNIGESFIFEFENEENQEEEDILVSKKIEHYIYLST